ncbi:MAG: SBBP repeat-containing protein [Gammaproteobacteria bacterium]|nr:SBBP repeat-containing protein [Gammaproteobacteria bacterium]
MRNSQAALLVSAIALLAVAAFVAPGFSGNVRAAQPLPAPKASDKIPPALFAPGKTARAIIVESYGKSPLTFDVNRGQTNARVKFLSRGNGHTLFLTPREAVLVLHETIATGKKTGSVLRMKLAGANPSPKITGIERQPGQSNYFIGNDPNKWRAQVPRYARVTYQDVYPGVDLVYYGNQRQLEYDFVVAPGIDPRMITLAFEGTPGTSLKIDAQGDLVLPAASGEIRQHKPHIYQVINGVKKSVAGNYALKNKHAVGFQIAAYDASKSLIIDPVLSWSTYLGGNGNDSGNGIAVDTAGNAYITGNTFSTNFPATGATSLSGVGVSDVFVTKLDNSGALVYSTYLGGSNIDEGRGIAVDTSGNAYVTGNTLSNNFPTKSAFQTTPLGGDNAFVTKLDNNGMLVYSTYLGGSGNDLGNGIAVDTLGNAYITGSTGSSDFPTAAPFQGTKGGTLAADFDAFITKLNSAGSALVYSTYLGGGRNDEGTSIAVDNAGNAYVTGFTMSATGDPASKSFPVTTPAFQASFAGGGDAFVTKLNAAGSVLAYSTYLGGSSGEQGTAIAVDASGGIYVTGTTRSTDFPVTSSAFQTRFGGNEDVFVTKLNASLTAPDYSTYLGGSDNDLGYGITVDGDGNAYMTGVTWSPTFPTANPTQPAFGGGLSDVFVTRLNATGAALIYSTYLGGTGNDAGYGIAVNTSRAIYLTGTTPSTNFPTTSSAFQSLPGGLDDAFATKITAPGLADLAVTKTGTPNPVTAGSNLTYTITVTNNGPDTATGVTLRDALPAGGTLISASPSQGSCSGATCALGTLNKGASATLTIVMIPTAAGTLSNAATATENENDPDAANNRAAANITATAAPSSGDSDTTAGNGGGCFIATAAYGSYLDPHVQTLREFRDRVLMPHRAGRAIVDLYYKYSPPIADLIAHHESLKIATRVALTPVIYTVMHPFAAGVFLLGILGMTGYKLRDRRRFLNNRIRNITAIQ